MNSKLTAVEQEAITRIREGVDLPEYERIVARVLLPLIDRLSSPPPALMFPAVVFDRLAGGWSYTFSASTRFIALEHPFGGRQSVLQVEPGCENYGEAIVRLLNAAGVAK